MTRTTRSLVPLIALCLVIPLGTAARAGAGDYLTDTWEYVKQKTDSAAGAVAEYFVGGDQQAGAEGEAAANGKPAAPSADSLPKRLTETWNDINKNLNEVLDARAKLASLPDSSWWPWENKQSAKKRIHGAIDNLSRLLLSSRAYESLGKIRQAQDTIAANSAKIVEYRTAQVSAPRDSLIARTSADYDKLIQETEKENLRLRNDIALHRSEVVEDLRGWGMKLNRAQEELLFTTVVGDDLIQNAIIATNIKTMVEKLAELSGGHNRDPKTIERYYGSYLTFIDVLAATTAAEHAKIGGAWIPRLASISARADAIIAAANKRLSDKNLDPALARSLQSSITSNRLTQKVCESYGAFLEQHKDRVESRLRELEVKRAVAQINYDTVSNSANLSDLIKTSLETIDLLGKIEIPDLRIFENLEQQREFEEITNRMRNAG